MFGRRILVLYFVLFFFPSICSGEFAYLNPNTGELASAPVSFTISEPPTWWQKNYHLPGRGTIRIFLSSSSAGGFISGSLRDAWSVNLDHFSSSTPAHGVITGEFPELPERPFNYFDFGLTFNGIVTIEKIEVEYTSRIIESLTASPTTLFLQEKDFSSSSVFTVTVNQYVWMVEFFLINNSSGVKSSLSSCIPKWPDFIGESNYQIWGMPIFYSIGSYTLFASLRAYPEVWKEGPNFEVKMMTPGAEIASLSVIPNQLWIDSTGAASGILLKAESTGSETIHFNVQNASGAIFNIGSAPTKEMNGKYIAMKSWWGEGLSLEAGEYQVTAAVGGSKKSTKITIVVVKGEAVGLSGTWMAIKDPCANMPMEVVPDPCSPSPWDDIAGKKPGYFASLAVSDPVNIAFGNFIHPEIDLKFNSRKGLVLARIYNSLDGRIGPFGRGWSSPYLSRLAITSNLVVLIKSDGGRTQFISTDGQTFSAPANSELKLVYQPDTTFWVVSHPNGTEWTFDHEGKIIHMAKACCGMGATDAVLCEYGQNGVLSCVTNPSGQALIFSSDANGRIIGVTDSTGRNLVYTYSPEGFLLSFTDPMGRVTNYEYSKEGFLTRIEKPGNRVTALTYVDQRVCTLTDADGFVSRFEWDFGNPKATLTDPSGVVHEYHFNSDWKFQSYSVPSLSLTKTFETNPEGQLTRAVNSLGGEEILTYDADNLIQSRTDALGYSKTFEYHSDFHKVTKKTDAFGRMWQYAYCQRGNLISETDPSGAVTSFRYDSHNNRISKTDPLGRISTYGYSIDGALLTSVTDALGGISSFTYDLRGNLLTSTDPLARTTMFSYDLLDRLTKTTYPDNRFVELLYDAAGNVATRRDHLGRETQYVHDQTGRLLSITRPDGSIMAMAYDAVGRKISETDPLGRITRFEYDDLGRLTKTIFPDDAFEMMTYDSEGRLISRTDALNRSTNFEFDAMGRLLVTIDPTGARWESAYDIAGRKISDKDPLGRATTYQFDVLDRVTKVMYPDGAAKENGFDSVGNLLSATDALGNVWSWVYDGLNRQVRTIRPDGASSTVEFDAAGQVVSETDPLGRKALYAYDSGGRRTSTTDPLGNVWQSQYDSAGRLIAVIDPLGATTGTTYDVMDRVVSQTDALGRVTQYEFDLIGRQVARADALGRRSLTTYDLRDRVLTQVDPEARTVRFSYDDAGQRLSLTDGANRVWRWSFDLAGRVTAETDPLGNVVRNGYDLAGNRVSRTNARGELTTYTFDLRNRLIQVTYPDGSVATMGYDLEGRELVRSWAGGVVNKTWDAVGNLTSESTAPWGKSWQYRFDLAGNRVGATDPDGKAYSYRFDVLNRMVKLDAPGQKDDIDTLYDAVGRLVREERASVESKYSYDAAGQLLELKHFRDKGRKRKLIASRQYSYDLVGNRVVVIDEDRDESRFSFDGSDWLTRAAYPGGKVISYLYNGAGDRLEEITETPIWQGRGKHRILATQTETLQYQYDDAGHMVARGADVFAFDADGNTISTTEGGKETRYLWSSDNRLVRAERTLPCGHKKGKCHCTPKVAFEEYAYQPESWKRITRTANDGRGDDQVFVSLYDGDDESGEYLVKEVKHHGWKCPKHRRCHCPPPPPVKKLDLLREFIGGPGTDDLVASKYRGHNVGLIKDALGSTIALTNNGGNPVGRINYDAWGVIEAKEKDPDHHKKPCGDADDDDFLDRFFGGWSFGNIDCWRFGKHFAKHLTPYLYTGRKLNNFTGQYFNRNRHYNPRVGRFSSSDPIGFTGDINLYRYANNNPLLYIDPYGEVALESYLLYSAIAGLSGYTVAYLQSPAGQKVIQDFRDFAILQYKKVEFSACEIGAAWEAFIHFSKPKDGKDNEYSREAKDRKQRGEDPCEWLAKQYQAARASGDTQALLKIKLAQKVMGCRRTHLD